jgi:hypothetical protein
MSNDTNPSPTQSRGCAMLFSLPFVAAGGYIMAISLGILPSDPEAFKAPRLVVAAAGAVFVLGGLLVLLQGSFGSGGQQTALYKWLEFFILGVFLIVFAGIFLWIGFGPGERTFQTTTNLGPLTTTGEGSPRIVARRSVCVRRFSVCGGVDLALLVWEHLWHRCSSPAKN